MVAVDHRRARRIAEQRGVRVAARARNGGDLGRIIARNAARERRISI